MSIDFINDDQEQQMMIVPTSTKTKKSVFKGLSVIVNHFVKDRVLVKRVEAYGREAVVFHGSSDKISKRYTTDFEIINALFVTFTPKTPEDYLCLVGSTQIDFYALLDDMYCSLAIPFKMCQAHSVSFGLLLERASLSGEFGNAPCASLFSLTHPYNEIFPVLCKFKDESQCHYTFRERKMKLIPDMVANYSPSFCGPTCLVMCYDVEERSNHIFMIRKCTKEERIAAKTDEGILNSSALVHTPSSMQHFYSPNFFNRDFIENRRDVLNVYQKNSFIYQRHHQSPIMNPLSFSNTSNQFRQQHPNSSFLMNSTAPGLLQQSSKLTPIRRYYTRSIAAAERIAFANPNPMGAIPSLASGDKSSAIHRSLEHSATLNRMRLKQKMGVDSLYTPRQGAQLSTADITDILSFGGADGDGEPPSSLDMAVEFCLEWVWSETLNHSEESTRGSTSSLGTERVASKLERLRVSSSASSHSDDKSELSRAASTFFISRNMFRRAKKYIIFHIPTERRIRILRLTFSTANENLSYIQSPILSETDLPSSTPLAYIRGNAIIPFLHSPYFMVLEVSPSAEQLCMPPLISLYSGSDKLANIALNIGSGVHLLRLLPVGRPSDGFNFFSIHAITAHDNDINENETFHQMETQTVVCQLQLSFSTEIANRCLHTMGVGLAKEHQMQFLSNIICSNPWILVRAAEQIPCISEISTDQVELALLFEFLFAHFGIDSSSLPYCHLMHRIRKEIGFEFQGESLHKRTRLTQEILNKGFTENDKFWSSLKADIALKESTIDLKATCLRQLYQSKIFGKRILDFLKKLIEEDCQKKETKKPFSVIDISQTTLNKQSTIIDGHKWNTAPRWKMDLRLHNVMQMFESSLPILIPNKTIPSFNNEVQQREQHEQFLISVAIRTLTRPFGQAFLNFRTRHGFSEKENDPMLGVKQICLSGRVHPGRNQVVDYPLNDTSPTHKLAMDWANFYTALAHGLSFCGDFPQGLFAINDELPSTMKAGLILAAGFAGNVLRNAMNLYDIHALLTQNNRHLVIALLMGCAADHRGTSEVHIYKMIATHLPFLLQPTLCEFRIDLVVQTAALISLGLLFCETANHTVSSQLLNQMSLEVPCESDQSSDRYSFVLTAGFAIGLINLGKGKELSDTEIAISSSPSLKDRLIKLLKGGERKMACLNYDKLRCPCIRVNNVVGPGLSGLNSSLGRMYAPGGGAVDGGVDNLNGPNTGPSSATQAPNSRTTDHSGIGQPASNHVRELPTLNIHLTSPTAAIALGLMYLRTGEAWIRNTLAIEDTFHEIEKIRPDMLLIRTLARCLVDLDEVQCTKEWVEAQIPPIIRKYANHFIEANSKDDLWWTDFVDIETVSKAYFYCSTGACFVLGLRFASSWDLKALRLIQNIYELLNPPLTEEVVAEYSWRGLAHQAGTNCVNACVNVLALSMALVMAGSGDLQTTRILRKLRNTIIKGGNDTFPLPKDSFVHSLHTSANMALGLLYFGHGRQCLSHSNLAIASLVISLFPLFPHSIIDNRFYFQPIRFLWVLAVAPNSNNKKIDETRASDAQEQQVMVECPRCGKIQINKYS